MNISDIIQLVVLCALIFCRLATMHAIPAPYSRYDQITVRQTSLY